VKEYEKMGLRPVDDTALGLVDYFREYYEENHTHPTMNTLVNTLGKRHGKRFSSAEAYKRFLYELFPLGPIQSLCKLAGLPDPGVENQS
jgi:tRNA 2-thiouridine synthesizing protein E